MLNGAHSLIAYCGVVAGLEAVRDVVAVPSLRRLVVAHMRAAAATVPPISGFDADAYANALISRFENPRIRHLCRQISADGSLKMPQRIFAAAADALSIGADGDAFALATAAWLRFLRGVDEAGHPIAPVDPLAADLGAAMRDAEGGSSGIVIAVAKVLGIADRAPFGMSSWREWVAFHLDALLRSGVRAHAEGLAHAH